MSKTKYLVPMKRSQIAEAQRRIAAAAGRDDADEVVRELDREVLRPDLVPIPAGTSVELFGLTAEALAWLAPQFRQAEEESRLELVGTRDVQERARLGRRAMACSQMAEYLHTLQRWVVTHPQVVPLTLSRRLVESLGEDAGALLSAARLVDRSGGNVTYEMALGDAQTLHQLLQEQAAEYSMPAHRIAGAIRNVVGGQP